MEDDDQEALLDFLDTALAYDDRSLRHAMSLFVRMRREHDGSFHEAILSALDSAKEHSEHADVLRQIRRIAREIDLRADPPYENASLDRSRLKAHEIVRAVDRVLGEET